MKRILASLILTMVLAACDEDEPDLPEEEPEPILDAGEPADASVEAGVPKVTNVGEACGLGLGRDCRGPAAQCLEISYSGAFYAGGYCTADCKSNAECGPEGVCPVPEAVRAQPSYPFRSTWARKCFRSCKPGVPGECRIGYACLSLAEAYAAHDAPTALQQPVCIPRAANLLADGGTGARAVDAGR
jgi:hypothetical protein